MIKMFIYFKNGNVHVYEVENVWKAREHAEKIWAGGYRMRVGKRMEWLGPHWIDKICWDVPKGEGDYMMEKYEGNEVI